MMKPLEIEAKSMEIIGQELKERLGCDPAAIWPEPELAVVKRCIHTSADFDYGDNLVFSKGGVQAGLQALKQGAVIVTDTNMAAAGINKAAAGKLGVQVMCFMADEDVAAWAKERGCTRAVLCMEKAAALKKPVIIAAGNAPTALIRLSELIKEGFRPQLVIGVPVGFVNVVESKELIINSNVPYVVARGRKGGSNIAAAVCNALLYQCINRVI